MFSKTMLLLDIHVIHCVKWGPWPFRAGRKVRDHAVEILHFTDEETETKKARDVAQVA